MSDDFASNVAGVGALAEPARRTLYLFVAAQPDAVSREQAASACDMSPHTARFHLDRLVDQGLLDVEFRRLTGRTGPGAGRTAKLYRRSEREVSVSLPARSYDLAGDILAEAIDRSVREDRSVGDSVAVVAEERGRSMAAEEPVTAGEEIDRVAQLLERHGYEPRADPDGLCLVNCPFDRLARDHRGLVCGMNLALIGGLLDELGCDVLEAVLDPEPGLCCVKARRR